MGRSPGRHRLPTNQPPMRASLKPGRAGGRGRRRSCERRSPTSKGLMTRRPSTLAVDPLRSRSASSMQSAPAIIAWIRVSASRPAGGPLRTAAKVDEVVDHLLDPRAARPAWGGAGAPALVIARVSSKATTTRRSGVREDDIGKKRSRPGRMERPSNAILPAQRAFLIIESCHPPRYPAYPGLACDLTRRGRLCSSSCL